MAKEFVMGARINMDAGNYVKGISDAAQQTQKFHGAINGGTAGIDKHSNSMADAAAASEGLSQANADAAKGIDNQSKSMADAAAASGRFAKANADAATSTQNMSRVARNSANYTRNSFRTMASNVKSSITTIGSNAIGGLKSNFSSLQSTVSSTTGSIASSIRNNLGAPFQGAIGMVKQYAGALGLLSAGALAGSGMKRLSAIENAETSLEVMMGDAKTAKAFLGDVLDFAKTTPFAFPDLAESSRNLIAFGMDSKKVVPTLKAIGDAAAATGKGSEGLNQVAGAFGDMQVSGTLSMDQINRLQSAGVPALKILANKAGKSVDDMKKSISKGTMSSVEAIDDLVVGMQKGTDGIAGKTAAMAGIMEKTKKNWTGSVDSLKSSISSTMAKIMTPIKPHIQDFMAWFGTQFSKLPDLLAKGYNAVKPLINSIKQIATAALPVLKAGFNGLKDGVISFAKAFAANWSKFEPYVIGLGIAFGGLAAMMLLVAAKTRIAAAAQFLFNAITRANPIILIVTLIGLLIGYLIHMAGGWDVVKEKLMILWQYMVQAWSAIWAFLQPILQQIGQLAIGIWQYLVDTVPGLLQSLWTTLVTWFTNIWLTIQPLLQVLWDGIVMVFESLKAFWHQWGDYILAYITTWWAFWSQIFIGAGQLLWTIVKGVFQTIYAIISGAFQMIFGMLESAWAIITGIFSVAMSVLAGDWQGAWDGMLGMLEGVQTGISTFFEGLKTLFFDSGKAIMTTLVDGIKTMVDAPMAAVKSAFSNVRNLLPFSDAKEGPLSKLTHNGGMIVSTIAEGVYKKAGALHKAMQRTLADTPTTAYGTAEMLPQDSTTAAAGGAVNANGYRVNPAGNQKAGGTIDRRTQIKNLIEKLVINGADKDGKQIADEVIEAIYEKLSQADDILSAADMEGLLYD